MEILILSSLRCCRLGTNPQITTTHDAQLTDAATGRQLSLIANVQVGRSVKLLLAFASTAILGFNLLDIHDQYIYSLLDMCFKMGPPLRRNSFRSTYEYVGATFFAP
jgi:hypothetical protein